MRVTDGRRPRLLPFNTYRNSRFYLQLMRVNLKADNPDFLGLAGHFTMIFCFLTWKRKT